jgi:hypothetical protein
MNNSVTIIFSNAQAGRIDCETMLGVCPQTQLGEDWSWLVPGNEVRWYCGRFR